MDGKSKNIIDEKTKQLKKLFPEILTEGKIDFEKLKLTLGKDINTDNERYVLNWAGKSEAFNESMLNRLDLYERQKKAVLYFKEK